MPGAVIYRGPSEIDGSPIATIAIWDSRNSKTGDMLQTYILREDMHPIEANRTGADRAICGDCSLKGVPTDKDTGTAALRECYVSLVNGPNTVWRTLKAGRYSDVTGDWQERQRIGRNRYVRITYGDGAAVPLYVWADLLREAFGHTAYSHTLRLAYPQIYMASVETLDQARAAWQDGYRTFRVVKDSTDLQPNEILCPNETRGVQCRDCMLCGGTSKDAKSIAITVHGSGKIHFLKRST